MSGSYTVTFSRLRASFTVDKELIGKQDPYVIFTSGNTKAQTKAIKGVGTGTAEWKETYSLEKFSPTSSSVIEVAVWNHNTLLPDNIIGTGTVDLSSQGQSSLSGSGDSVSVILVDKKGQETGTISFLVNGGGYTGSGRTGTGSYSSSTGTGAGVGAAGVGGYSGSNTTGTGGYSGSNTTGTGTGGYSGSNTTGTGTGGYSGSNTTGTGVGGYSGSNTNGASNTSGTVVGKGYGTDQSTAQLASDKAAATGRTQTVEESGRLGVGHPVSTTSGTSSTSTGRGNTSLTGSNTGLTGSNTGVTSGVASGVTGSATGVAVRGAAASDRTVYGEREGDIIDRKYYVGTESRPQDQALVETYREHNPYAKDYETTVQHTGRERLVQSQIEALGTRERVVTQDHLVYAHPHQEIARHLPAEGVVPGLGEKAGALADRPGGEGWVQTKPGPICDTNTFSIAGDRTVDKERVTDLREHREFEKEFEVKTRLVGERLLNRGTEAEIINRERVLVDEKSKIACEGHPQAAVSGGNTLAAQGARGVEGYSSSTTGVGSGTGYTGTGTGVGSGTGYSGTGTGVGSGTGYSGTGTGVGSGTRGTTGQTTGEKVASYIPGSEENKEKKGQPQGYGQTAGEKAASYVPGSEENREKKAAQYA